MNGCDNIKNTSEIASKLYYYGARYYDPKTSVFMGVDPLADKYPSLSPFAYCANNPIKLIDPDGQGPWDIVAGVGLIGGGVAQMAGGVSLIATGVGAPLGVGLIMSGSSSIGFGVATIVNNGKKDIPTGWGQAAGRVYDKANKNSNQTGEIVGSIADWGLGFLGGPLKAPLKNVARASNVISTANEIRSIKKAQGNDNDLKNRNNSSKNASQNNSNQSNESINMPKLQEEKVNPWWPVKQE